MSAQMIIEMDSDANESNLNHKLPFNPTRKYEIPKELRNTFNRRKCEFCHFTIDESECYLQWQGLDFCLTLCLEGFIFTFLERCSYRNCTNEKIPTKRIGRFVKWCGPLLRGFCGPSCIIMYKKSLKNCAHCSGEIYIENSQSIVCVEESTCLDFCSIDCWLSEMGPNTVDPRGEPSCRICSAQEQKYKVLDGTDVKDICSDECLLYFQRAFDLVLRKCTQCNIRFDFNTEGHALLDADYEPYPVCSDVCRSRLINARQRTVGKCSFCHKSRDRTGYIHKFPGQWRTDFELICSLECLARWVTTRKVPFGVCSWCCLSKRMSLYYILTDGSIHNFCSRACSNSFFTAVERTFYQPIIGWRRIIGTIRTRNLPLHTNSIKTPQGSRWLGTLDLLD